MAATIPRSYPVRFQVDYPDHRLNRLTTAFRPIVALPILIVIGTLSGMTLGQGSGRSGVTLVSGGGVLFLALVLLIVFRRKYPRWWFDWNLNFLRFSNRVTAYLALLGDRYPSTDEEQAVHLDFAYPDAQQLNRWLPLVKCFLAIPHYFLLCFLWIAALVVIVVAWFAILFTGSYPQGLFDFVVGVMRWTNRVTGYAVALVTDEYPPFSLR